MTESSPTPYEPRVQIRGDAIKAVQVAALKKWAPRMDGLTTWEAGVVVDAVEPFIRADEAARHHDGGDCECTSVYADGTWLHTSSNVTAMRAKLEALRSPPISGVPIDDVLAMLSEGVSE